MISEARWVILAVVWAAILGLVYAFPTIIPPGLLKSPWGIIPWAGLYILSVIILRPALQCRRVKCEIQGDDIDDQIAQAMAEIGFTFEPGSRFGDTVTFRSRFHLHGLTLQMPSQLVVTMGEGAIVVFGRAYWIEQLGRRLAASALPAAELADG